MKKLIGTGVALVTPFDKDLKVDFQGLKNLLHSITTSKVRYLVVHGTTGESPTTTVQEKEEILAFVQANNPSALPIVYGVGGNDTATVLRHIQTISWSGIDVAMVASPYYNKPSQRGIVAHYTAIADACPIPVLLYNVPSRTGSNMTAETTLVLSQHPNIVGIKEASGDVGQCLRIIEEKPDDFLLISGDDLLTLPMMAIGGVGVISTVANGFPIEMSALVEYALQGDFVKARSAYQGLFTACRLIEQMGNPVGTKHLLKNEGICEDYVRLPLVSA